MLAIILSRNNFREYDQIISAYTKEKGKLELLARGVKKIISKNSAHLEPFSFVHVGMAEGKGIDCITSVQSIDTFAGIRKSLQKRLMATTVVSITDTLLQAEQPDNNIFQLLRSWLLFVENTEFTQTILIDAYAIKLFDCLGFTPVLVRCVICKKSFQDIVGEEFSQSIDKERRAGIYFSGGGLVCPACFVLKKDIGEQIFACGLREVSDMILLLRGDWQTVNNFSIEVGQKKKLHSLVYEFVIFHSERKLVDWGEVHNVDNSIDR